jgi:hypothetical protein
MTADLANGQSKVDILTRHGIPLEFGDRQFRVRPRTMTHDRQWVDLVSARITSRVSAFMGEDLTIPTIIGALGDSPSDMLDLVIAYDETDQLPPREWIEEHAITSQITTAFTTLLEVAYPPFAVSRRLLPADRAARIIGSLLSYAIEQSVKASSSEPTALPSPTGATGRRKKSTTRSPTASSSS